MNWKRFVRDGGRVSRPRLTRAHLLGGLLLGLLGFSLVVQARQTQLFLQGTRLYDIARFMKVDPALVPLVPAAGTDYPEGGKYGDLGGNMCMPLPDIERANNPNIGV